MILLAQREALPYQTILEKMPGIGFQAV